MGHSTQPNGDSPRRALVVGRFQPPHRGHLELLRNAAKVADETIVVVGSAQRSHTPVNPLTAGERVEAVTALARDDGVPVAHIVPVVDLDQYHLWVAHVESQVPSFHVVVAANPMTLHLFSKAGYAVEPVEPVRRDEWSGTQIRRRLLSGQDVASHLTPGVSRLLDREGIKERLRAIAEQQEGTKG